MEIVHECSCMYRRNDPWDDITCDKCDKKLSGAFMSTFHHNFHGDKCFEMDILCLDCYNKAFYDE